MIPDYQIVMLPLLTLLGNGQELAMSNAVAAIATEFSLSAEERQALLPSGTSTEQFPEFMEFRALRHTETSDAVPDVDTSTPEEALEEAYEAIRADLKSDLLQRVRSASPAFFERMVVELLVRVGYGGTIRDAGQAVGRSGDGGIDGIIKEDRLGLDLIYIQAKRWENPVGSPEVHKFVGALAQRHARKGVLITTSSFTKDAREVVGHLESRVVLVDGPTLAALMLDHNVGVSATASYEIKKIDTDFFAED